MLLRVKHHALSVYDPVSAGLHCPHGACLNAGRVNLYHVFWTCPAANRLRTIFVDKWKAAGLRMESYERAIFALTLQEEPTAIIKQTGSILADCMDVTIGDLGGIVESIVEQCWALGAAQYLHAVWRWRVAFFDEHNNTTCEYHEANFKARLRSSHAGVMSAHNDGVHNTLLGRLGKVIHELLDNVGYGAPAASLQTTTDTVLFYAGRTTRDNNCGYSGSMVTQVNRVTGHFHVEYDDTVLTQERLNNFLVASNAKPDEIYED